eukprot:TRINITY_DN18284_c0_g1_i1.p1 TRINITY_DN18284_c0_g1~~TRINITY_DN18284_c0_g1_i1.p1  ORF type:complete len:348 (-),score=99.17 TRINITY_DN18284_c0_g1_i1:47-1090(-)
MKAIQPFVLLLIVNGVTSRPLQGFVQNVPYHRQVTDYACGDASTEMVFHHFGSDVDQRAIIDVMRTSDSVGTLSFDVVRAGHFSLLSAAAATNVFPAQAPTNGWSKTRPFGYGAFSYRSTECWLDAYKDVLASGVPLITLMYYATDDLEGHFRVGIGYNDSVPGGQITMLDPWDRDSQPRVVHYNESTFCFLWSHAETNGAVVYEPYFAAVFAPWQIDIAFNENDSGNVSIAATVTYPLPPLPPSAANMNFTAQQCSVAITLPPTLVLLDGSPETNIGALQPGQQAVVEWVAFEKDPLDKSDQQSFITVLGSGFVAGSVPATYCCNSTDYPGYSYQDLVGSFASVNY